MSLTAKDVAEITRLLEESSFDELYLEMDGLKLSLRRGAAASLQPGATLVPPTAPPGPPATPSPSPPVLSPVAPAGAASAGAAPAAAAATPPTAPPADPNSVNVPAPLLGTFYRAPKPGAPPFVEIGAKVEADTIIGIIEVMKLMNTVRAGVRGVVTEILGRDGALVEYGETLMRVGKSD